MANKDVTRVNEETREVWNQNAAFWNERMGEGNDFVEVLIWPATERLLKLQPGERILDVACGNGLSSHRLAALGAEGVAFDFAEEMIAYARQRTTKHGDRINYLVLDATDEAALLGLGQRQFDAALCNMALFDIAEIEPLIRALAQILRPGGRFVFSIRHPCFNSPHIAQVAEMENRDGEIVTAYAVKVFKYKNPTVAHAVAIRGQPKVQLVFHRPLHRLLGTCFKAGFVLDGLEERAFPPDHPPSRNPLAWGANFSEIPPILITRMRLSEKSPSSHCPPWVAAQHAPAPARRGAAEGAAGDRPRVSQPGSRKTRHGDGKAPMFIFKLIVGIIMNVAIFGGLLLLPAGTLAWWRAWLFIGVMVAIAVWSSFSLPRDLLDERFKPPIQKGQPLADKIVLVLLLATFCGLLVFIPLDVFRFHLLAKPGTLVSSLGLVLVIAGCWIIYLALRENTFAAPVVKHQAERHQTVIATGVYGVVRHPMYAGAVLLLVGLPLWLESYAAALLASVPIGTLAVRIVVEEQFLRRELKGYDAYTERIRYRLILFLW